MKTKKASTGSISAETTYRHGDGSEIKVTETMTIAEAQVKISQLGKELAEAQHRLSVAKKTAEDNYALAVAYGKAVRQQAAVMELLTKLSDPEGELAGFRFDPKTKSWSSWALAI